MKFKKEIDFKAEELYNLLSNEITENFTRYVKTIKNHTLEELNGMDDLVTLVEREQPIQYCVFVGLLNADLDLNTIKVLIEIEKSHGNLVKNIANKLNELTDKINIFNEDVVKEFIKQSVYLLATYYIPKEQ